MRTWNRGHAAAPIALGVIGLSQLVATVPRLIAANPAELLHDYMADDAFYYDVLARNFPRVEVTRGITTTGFHPLYLVVLVPVFHLFHGWTAPRLALVILLLAHIGAGFLLYALLRRRWSEVTAALLAGLWIASAELRTIVLLGVETALVEVTVLGLLLICDPEAPATTRRCVGVGAVLALAYLARNDSLFVCGPVVGAWIWARRRDVRPHLVGRLATIGGAAMVVASPWLVYLAAHGSLVQTDSARALPSLSSPHDRAGHAIAMVWASVSAMSTSLVLNRPKAHSSELKILFATVALATLIGTVTYGWTRWNTIEATLVVSVPVLFGVYVLSLGEIRPWYLVYAYLALFVAVLPPLVDALWRRSGPVRQHVRTRPELVAAVAVAVAVALTFAHPFAPFPEERAKYEAALDAAPLMGTQAAGSFNSGIYQFVLDGRDVENLDGVVNPEVQVYRGQQRLCDYLARHHIRWIIDEADQIHLAVDDGSGARLGPEHVLVAADGGRPAQVLASVDTGRCR